MWSKFHTASRGLLLSQRVFLSPSPLLSTTFSSFSTSHRYFSNYSSQEQGFQVDWDDTLPDPDDFTPSYLPDHKKMEIYYKHQQDPKEWSVKAISARYGMSLIRAQAILYMMKKRVALMEELGVLNIPLQWAEIYGEHLTDPEAMTKEALAEKHEMEVEEVENILKKMGEHSWRKKNLNDSNDYHDQVLDFLAMGGQFPSPHPPPLTLPPSHQQEPTLLSKRLVLLLVSVTLTMSLITIPSSSVMKISRRF
jgi:hypothetical protein